ncbi:MAG: transporter [Sphingomonadales bacterium]|nr:transporter [Sphingomonadales bacterium]
MMNMVGRVRGSQGHFILLFAVMLTIGAGNTALQSVMPAIGRTLHIRDNVIALSFSLSAAVWVIAAPYWARRSDRTGRRQMVLIGIAGFSVSVLSCGLVLTAGINSLIAPVTTMLAFIVARVIYGVFGAAAPPAAQAILAGQTTRAERTKALTLLASAFGLGTILGPALASYFVLPGIGLAGPAYFFAVGGLLVLGAVWRWLPHDEPGSAAHGAVSSYPSIGGEPTGASVAAAMSEGTPGKLKLTDPRIWPWMLVGLISGHAQAMTGQAMAFLVIDRLHLDPTSILSQQTIGLVLTTGAGASLLVQWGVIPQLNLTPKRLIVVGLVLAAVGLAATSSANSLFGLAMAFGLSSAGFGFTRPGYTAGSSLAVGSDLQGAVAGRVTSINGASFVLGPSLGVGLYEVWRPLPYLVATALCALLAGYALWKLRSSDLSESASPA